jgi:hypothetical protein
VEQRQPRLGFKPDFISSTRPQVLLGEPLRPYPNPCGFFVGVDGWDT